MGHEQQISIDCARLAEEIERNVRTALEEDLGSGDVSAQLIDPLRRARARLMTREACVLAGKPWFDACFRALDPHCDIRWHASEGDRIAAGTLLCEIAGQARALLSAERPALNFLQTLSATATRTRRYVEASNNANVLIMDTRKTLPGLRVAQKYAVAIAGGANQRFGLYDGVLIKENHIAASGGIAQALQAAAGLDVPVQIEVEDLAELELALKHGAKLILLDNLDVAMLREAVRINAGRAQLEASGGITLDNIAQVAQTGVARISVGALTKHIEAIDLSLRFELESASFATEKKTAT